MTPTFPRLLAEAILIGLRLLATILGYLLACLGWLIFALGALRLAEPYPPGAEYFRSVGVSLIVPGWFLLRFAGGLFPFGRKMFR